MSKYIEDHGTKILNGDMTPVMLITRLRHEAPDRRDAGIRSQENISDSSLLGRFISSNIFKSF